MYFNRKTRLQTVIWLILFINDAGFFISATPSALDINTILYDDVELPCQFNFISDEKDLHVLWEKFTDDGEVLVVHSFRNGQDEPTEQDVQYKGRTSLSTDFSKGKVHLKLKDVSFADEGTFTCRAANPKNKGDRAIQLSITEMRAADPTVTTEMVDGEKRLKCIANGVFNNPRFEWHDGKKTNLTDYVKEPHISSIRNDEGTVTVESVLNYPYVVNEHYLCQVHEGRFKRSVRAVPSDGHSVKIQDEF